LRETVRDLEKNEHRLTDHGRFLLNAAKLVEAWRADPGKLDAIARTLGEAILRHQSRLTPSQASDFRTSLVFEDGFSSGTQEQDFVERSVLSAILTGVRKAGGVLRGYWIRVQMEDAGAGLLGCIPAHNAAAKPVAAALNLPADSVDVSAYFLVPRQSRSGELWSERFPEWSHIANTLLRTMDRSSPVPKDRWLRSGTPGIERVLVTFTVANERAVADVERLLPAAVRALESHVHSKLQDAGLRTRFRMDPSVEEFLVPFIGNSSRLSSYRLLE